MKFYIITPCYNSSQFLDETINSVLSQKGNFEIEYIIIDNESKDNTSQIIEKYVSLINNYEYHIKCNFVTIKYICEKDNGMYDAISKGFEMILKEKIETNDIVAYLNSDDYYLPNAFNTISKIFDEFKDVKWISGISNVYNKNGAIIPSKRCRSYKKNYILSGVYGTTLSFIQQESVFWRGNLLKDLNLNKFRKLKYAGDYYIWYTFAKKYNLYTVNSVFSGFRIRKGQLSENLELYNHEFEKIYNKRKFFVNKFIEDILEFSPPRLDRYLRKKYIYYDFKKEKWILNK